MAKYIDLKIDNDDISTDAAGQPLLVTDRDVIAQDVNHAIRESGYLTDIIGERNAQKRALIRKKMRMVIEGDNRIIPGSSIVKEAMTNTKTISLTISAETEFGPVTVGVY